MWSHLEREIIFIPPMNTFIHTQNTLHMYCTTQILYVSTTLQRTDTHPQWRSWSQPGCGYKANQHTHFFFFYTLSLCMCRTRIAVWQGLFMQLQTCRRGVKWQSSSTLVYTVMLHAGPVLLPSLWLIESVKASAPRIQLWNTWRFKY